MSLAELNAYKDASLNHPDNSPLASNHHSKRKPPESREFRFYVSKAAEIDSRYAGKHVAIIGESIVASGKSPLEVYKRAKKSHPNSRPLLARIPKDESLVS